MPIDKKAPILQIQKRTYNEKEKIIPMEEQIANAVPIKKVLVFQPPNATDNSQNNFIRDPNLPKNVVLIYSKIIKGPNPNFDLTKKETCQNDKTFKISNLINIDSVDKLEDKVVVESQQVFEKEELDEEYRIDLNEVTFAATAESLSR